MLSNEDTFIDLFAPRVRAGMIQVLAVCTADHPARKRESDRREDDPQSSRRVDGLRDHGLGEERMYFRQLNERYDLSA